MNSKSILILINIKKGFENMGIKKIIALILTLTMVLGLSTACDSSTGSSQSGGQASSDEYPQNNLRIIVGYSAGGSSDKLARILQPFLEDELGVSVVVENMPGASGQIAATTLMRENADGYTLLAVNAPGIYYTIAMQDTVYGKDDLYPVWVESNDPIVLLTMNGSAWNNLNDFIDDARANPGKYSLGFAAGGGQQAIALWLKENLNLDINLVSYDGGSASSAALLGGHVDAICGDAYARVDLVGEAKCLAIASDVDNAAWPDAPSFNEQLESYGAKLPDAEFQARYGAYWVQKKFADEYPDRLDKLIAAFERVAKNEEYIKMLKDSGVYDSMVLESGKGYSDSFKDSCQVVIDVVAPLLESANN